MRSNPFAMPRMGEFNFFKYHESDESKLQYPKDVFEFNKTALNVNTGATISLPGKL